MNVTATTLLSSIRTSIKEDKETLARRAAATKSQRVRDAAKRLARVVKKFEQAHVGSEYDFHVSTYVETYDEALNATVYMRVDGIKGNAPLERALGQMLDTFDTARGYDHVSEYTTSRAYVFKSARPDDLDEFERWTPHLRVEIVCRVSDDSSTCRKVQVGTKLVEQPEYRLECV